MGTCRDLALWKAGRDGPAHRTPLTSAVNDQNSQEALENYEFLVRYLLERPGSPAVLEFQ